MLGTLEFVLTVPVDVRRGWPATVSVDLVNRGDTLVQLGAPGGSEAPPFDVYVLRAPGDTIWRDPPSGFPRSAILRENAPIPPGEAQRYGTAQWDQTDWRGQPVGPGAYLISVRLHAPAPWGLVSVGPAQLTIAP